MDGPDLSEVDLPPLSGDNGLRRTARKRALVLAAVLAGMLALSADTAGRLPRICLWYRLTGTDCPFCGLTRSVIAAGHFHLAQAFKYHPLGPLVLAGLVAVLIVSVLRWTTGRPREAPRRVQKIIFAVVSVGWLAWWVAARVVG